MLLHEQNGFQLLCYFIFLLKFHCSCWFSPKGTASLAQMFLGFSITLCMSTGVSLAKVCHTESSESAPHTQSVQMAWTHPAHWSHDGDVLIQIIFGLSSKAVILICDLEEEYYTLKNHPGYKGIWRKLELLISMIQTLGLVRYPNVNYPPTASLLLHY